MHIKKLVAVPVLVAAAAFAAPASALTIEANDGFTFKSCTDGDVLCDATGAIPDGQIVWFLGTTFAGWKGVVNIGSSNAPDPGADAAEVHLTTNLEATKAGVLDIWVYDKFTAPIGAGTLIFTGIGGETGAASATGYGRKLDYETFKYLTDVCDIDLGLTGGRCTTSTAHPYLGAGYYLDLFTTVTATGATGAFSLDLDVYNVPEPGSLALLGLGLLGFAGSRRRLAA